MVKIIICTDLQPALIYYTRLLDFLLLKQQIGQGVENLIKVFEQYLSIPFYTNCAIVLLPIQKCFFLYFQAFLT